MKNTHHAEMTELVIGRNPDWLEGVNRVLEEKGFYSTDVETNENYQYFGGQR